MSESFYLQCAELLGTSYNCKPFPYSKRTRWNNRAPGSGRYPGFGTIRKFGNQVHMSLRHPVSHSKVYANEDDAITFLKNLHLA